MSNVNHILGSWLPIFDIIWNWLFDSTSFTLPMNYRDIKVNRFEFLFILLDIHIVLKNQQINWFFCIHVRNHTILLHWFLRVSKKKNLLWIKTFTHENTRKLIILSFKRVHVQRCWIWVRGISNVNLTPYLCSTLIKHKLNIILFIISLVSG